MDLPLVWFLVAVTFTTHSECDHIRNTYLLECNAMIVTETEYKGPFIKMPSRDVCEEISNLNPNRYECFAKPKLQGAQFNGGGGIGGTGGGTLTYPVPPSGTLEIIPPSGGGGFIK